MAIDVLMPVLTEPGEDGVVTAWLVDEGGVVEAGQIIAEIQVEKVAEDVSAPETGIVVGLAPINEPVAQGQPICRILAPEEAEAVEVGEEAPKPSREPAPPAHTAPPSSPAARRLARELGVDLATVRGSGPGGRITEADVRGARGGPGSAMAGLRSVIARNMRRSHLETAPVTLISEVELDREPSRQITAAVVVAAASALAEHPALNGTREGDRFVPAASANVAVAVQTDQGLVSPVVKDPVRLGIDGVHEEIARLAERARAGSLTMADYEGGTFTVTNLGAYGVDAFTPIINLPQVAVLGVGAARQVPGLTPDGRVVPVWRIVLSLTFDHAFVDGAPAAAFLRDVATRLRSRG